MSRPYEGLSPELVPIVTLLSSQIHRRYYEGIFMLYYDLNGEGKPADREWKEVYGILTGTQLAYWDANNLVSFKNNPKELLNTNPMYINLTDSIYNALKVLATTKQNLLNIIILSTTLKNRFLLQYKSYADLISWYSSFRLSNFEYLQLQKAYTGALLSARGSRLSDIRTILAEKRFDHEDWVSIRYGSGMAWKKCYVVIEPSTMKKKVIQPGRMLIYESDQKKKKQLMATVINVTLVTAIYPQSHKLIDHSTLLKLEGFINFTSPSVSAKISKKSVDDFKSTSMFIMPAQHKSVPEFDTLIRFFIPLIDAFGLYGRPKRLKADRVDPDSLLFGLPTLPHVHYLELNDVSDLAKQGDFLNWDSKSWAQNFTAIMKSKLNQGYEGCGSTRGVQGAISSMDTPVVSKSSTFSDPSIPLKSTSSLSSNNQQLRANSEKILPDVRDKSNNPINHLIMYNNGSSAPRNPGYASSPSNSSNGSGKPGFAPSSNNGLTSMIGSAAIGGVAAKGFSDKSRNVHDLQIQPSTGGPKTPTIITGASDDTLSNSNLPKHKSVQLDDIYRKYSKIEAPSDRFNSDRNQLLPDDDDDESLEYNLPEEMKTKASIYTDMYPTNDKLFDDDEEDDVSSNASSEKFEVRQVGMMQNNTHRALAVPGSNDRDSGSSFVKSPLTQYNEFADQFNRSLSIKKKDTQRNFGEFSDEHEPSTPVNDSSENFSNKYSINTVPRGAPTEGPRKSIHSESGALSDSSTYSHPSYQSINSTGGGLRISSPNKSQNISRDTYDMPSLPAQNIRNPQFSQNSPSLASPQAVGFGPKLAAPVSERITPSNQYNQQRHGASPVRENGPSQSQSYQQPQQLVPRVKPPSNQELGTQPSRNGPVYQNGTSSSTYASNYTQGQPGAPNSKGYSLYDNLGQRKQQQGYPPRPSKQQPDQRLVQSSGYAPQQQGYPPQPQNHSVQQQKYPPQNQNLQQANYSQQQGYQQQSFTQRPQQQQQQQSFQMQQNTSQTPNVPRQGYPSQPRTKQGYPQPGVNSQPPPQQVRGQTQPMGSNQRQQPNQGTYPHQQGNPTKHSGAASRSQPHPMSNTLRENRSQNSVSANPHAYLQQTHSYNSLRSYDLEPGQPQYQYVPQTGVQSPQKQMPPSSNSYQASSGRKY